ncbi:universal stress protein [Streptomyces sp. NPDC047097]|uniref:universal stress protein n=1 Tax=Streptomyces sp. NPDC047097 TaxID=3155260 RepID=UPI0033D3D5CF
MVDTVITAGVDGSGESMAAVDWAADEAVRHGVPLRLVHAWLWQPVDVPIVQDRDVQERAAHGILRDAQTRAAQRHPELECTAAVVDDTAVSALLREAGRGRTLVLGTRGHGRLLGFLLGSYGQQVIAAAEGPVVSVRAAAPDARPAEGGEILVGQQGSPRESADVLEFAFRAAAARGAGVRAVRAWNLPPVQAYALGGLEAMDEAGGPVPYEEKALAEALAPWRDRYPHVPVAEHVELGSAGQVLLSQSPGARLVVVGRRVRHAPVGVRIGSVAHAVLHHAPCPVAVVPHS